MMFTIHVDKVEVHYHSDNSVVLEALQKLGEEIMATQADIVAKLNDTNTKLVKVGQETSTLLVKIDELKAVIAAGPVTPELQAAVDALAAQAQVVDDLVPDQVPTV